LAREKQKRRGSGPRRQVIVEKLTFSGHSSKRAADPLAHRKDGKQDAKEDDDNKAERHEIRAHHKRFL